MIELIEYIIGVMIIVWFIDHIILRGKHTTRFWLIVDITAIFLLVMRYILTRFL